MTIVTHIMNQVKDAGIVNAQFKNIKLKIGQVRAENWYNFMFDGKQPGLFFWMGDVKNGEQPIKFETRVTIERIEELVTEFFEPLFYEEQ